MPAGFESPHRRHRIGQALLLVACAVHPIHSQAQAYDGRLIDAVRITLERQAAIAISRQEVSIAEGGLLSAKAAFDPVINAGVAWERTRTPLSEANPVSSPTPPFGPISTLSADSSQVEAGVTKKLRSGVTVNTALRVNQVVDNFASVNAPSQANVTLSFTLPLARGRGERVTTAYERAAQLRRDALLQASQHAVSSAVTATVLAYWDVLAAQQTLEIVQAAEARAQSLLNDTRKLAAAQLVPQLDVRKFESRLPSQAAQRIGAEQAVVRARARLGLAMGLSPGETAAMPAPTDGFQLVECCDGLTPGKLRDAVASLVAAARQGRGDLLSVQNNLRASEALLLAARDTHKPQLDLRIGVGYNGMTERSAGASTPSPLSALGSNVRGGNAFIGLNYVFPVNNQTARGLALQQAAALEQVQLEKRALEDRVASSVETGLGSVLGAAEQLRQAQTAIRIQTEVYEGEKKKYLFGLSTLLDLFSNEAQLVANQLSLIETQLSLASAMVQLRFETGTLLHPETEAQTLDHTRLVRLPQTAGTPATAP